MDDLRRWDGEQFLLSLGLFLLNVVFFTLVLSTALFVAGIPVSPFHLPAAVLLAGAAGLIKKPRKQAAAALIAGLAVLALCLAMAGYVNDWSWDGNLYHKGMTGALTWGWNPLRESFFQFAEDYPFLEHCIETWYDAYPKATEIFGACAHSMTGNIETGKASNLLLMAALFFLAWGLLVHTGLFKHWQAFPCAGLAVLTPVSASQVFTYYNDASLANMLLLCLMGLLYFTFYPRGELRPMAGYFIFVSINVGFNLKFSAVLFFAILCLTFFGFWTVGEVRKGGLSGAVQALRGRFCLLAASVLSGVLLLGSTSYVTNTLRYHNPLYTMIGPGSSEIIISEMPVAYRSMGNLTRFLASFFSYADTSLEIETVQLKIPFTFSADESYAAAACDVRIAGWGMFFSGIFLVSAAVITVVLAKRRQSCPMVFRLTLLLSAMLAVSAITIPGLSWARYFTALFLIPVAALLFLFAWWNRSGGAKKVVCAAAITAMLCVNLIPNAYWSLLLLRNADRAWTQLAQLKELTETRDVILSYADVRFEGRIFNVYDAGIDNFTFDPVGLENYTGILFDRYPLYYYVPGQEAG